MKGFKEFIDEKEHQTNQKILNEGAFKTASTAALIGHIISMRTKIKRSKKITHETLDALASMILANSYLIVSLDHFSTRRRK
jgi:hypothetical protein